MKGVICLHIQFISLTPVFKYKIVKYILVSIYVYYNKCVKTSGILHQNHRQNELITLTTGTKAE